MSQRSPSASPVGPWPLRAAWRLFQATASLRLAVVVISLYIVVLVWSTGVMSYWYADDELKYGIYHSWWFAGLNALLALNVLNAALIRFPWKRRQIGFLITHAGILVLLAGSWVSYYGGVDATLAAYEGGASNKAFENQNHFEMYVMPASSRTAKLEGKPKIVPFRAGPFNWDDYGHQHAWFPWGLTRHDSGVLYDEDGITLEVLDYYHDSQRRPLPRLELLARSAAPRGGKGLRDATQQLVLAVSTPPRMHGGGRPFGMGVREGLETGQHVLFWMTGSRDETAAFLSSRPEGSLGQRGQLVFYHKGETYRFKVDELADGGRVPLGKSGLEIELAALNPMMMGFAVPAAQLLVYAEDEAPQRLMLYAALPHWNIHDRQHGVYGAYWLPVSDEKKDADAEGDRMAQVRRDTRAPRIDILQGDDQKLYYRTWRMPGECEIGTWPGAAAEKGDERHPDAEQASRLVAFPNTADAVVLEQVEHIAAKEPTWQVLPLPYKRELKRGHTRQPRAKVRLTVDGKAEEFWLAGPGEKATSDQERQIEGKGRSVLIAMPQNVIDLGFEVFLRRFEQKLDPGEERPSYFSSLVDFREPSSEENRHPRVLQNKVLITLNAPVDFVDPKSNRSYRLFQTSFEPPKKPGDALYDQMIRPDEDRAKLNRSVFSVNYDPGRALKYTGSLLIVVGIAVFYYVKITARRRI